MDVQQQLAAAAMAKYRKNKGIEDPPPAKPVKQQPVVPVQNSESRGAAKNAAAAALAAKMGGGPPPARRTAPSPANPRAPPRAAAPSKSSGGNVGSLSATDQAKAAPYQKMIKLGIPEGAIRQRMGADGIPNHVQDAVFAPSGPSSSTPAQGSAAKPRSNRGVGSQNTPSGKTTASSLSAADEQVAEPYRRMVKIGLPQAIVQHKMTADAIPAHIQKSILGGGSSPTAAGGGPAKAAVAASPAASGASRSKKISKLSPDDEQIAYDYRKKAKIGLPESALRHKMMADGVAQHIQDSVLAGEEPAPRTDVVQAKKYVPSPVRPTKVVTSAPHKSIPPPALAAAKRPAPKPVTPKTNSEPSKFKKVLTPVEMQHVAPVGPVVKAKTYEPATRLELPTVQLKSRLADNDVVPVAPEESEQPPKTEFSSVAETMAAKRQAKWDAHVAAQQPPPPEADPDHYDFPERKKVEKKETKAKDRKKKDRRKRRKKRRVVSEQPDRSTDCGCCYMM